MSHPESLRAVSIVCNFSSLSHQYFVPTLSFTVSSPQFAKLVSVSDLLLWFVCKYCTKIRHCTRKKESFKHLDRWSFSTCPGPQPRFCHQYFHLPSLRPSALRHGCEGGQPGQFFQQPELWPSSSSSG